MDTQSIIALGILSLPCGIALYMMVKASKLTKQVNVLEKENATLLPLKKYEVVSHAETEARSIIEKAKRDADEKVRAATQRLNEANITHGQIIKEAEAELKKAKEKAYNKTIEAHTHHDNIIHKAKITQEQIIKEAKAELKRAKEKAEASIQDAFTQADKIIKQAESQAENIAGEALKAKSKADTYESTAKAMRNIIDGYGNEYLIANQTVLDDLAEDFSHKDAGIELKKARLLTKQLVTRDRATNCDYAEQRRKVTAERFVLDAFNGKVDSALTKVKHDNYGKLEAEIKDAFGLVNGNGHAFRNARITSEYLSARLDELKWAVATHELRLQEREEQRQIKEAIREEEKARREMEKAIKEAEKEEKLLQKAMDKARRELSKANEAEKIQFEEKLAILQEQLEQAEAKNQRAISMAQQTRRGHVYVISNVGSFGEDVYKIGLTRRLEPMDRVKELSGASVPFDFDVHAMIYSEDAPKLEKDLHRIFEPQQVNKINYRKEFFKTKIADIKAQVQEMGIEAHWTMKAEAIEFRETQAIEFESYTAQDHELQKAVA